LEGDFLLSDKTHKQVKKDAERLRRNGKIKGEIRYEDEYEDE